jgi:exopolysaccharide biosynthesis polyprenyl glycosylphosphotransferase
MKKTGILGDFRRNFEAIKTITPLLGTLYLVLMYSFGLYKFINKDQAELIYTLFLISVTMMIGTMGICFFVRDISLAFPRSVILISSLVYFIFLTLWRSFLLLLSKKRHGKKTIIIIYGSENRLCNTLKQKYASLYQIKYESTGKDPDLSEKIKAVDDVFLCEDVRQKEREQILPLCIHHGKSVHFIPKYLDLSLMSSSLLKVDDIPVFYISNMELSMEERLVKRLIDLSLGIAASIVFLPFGLIVALLVKLDGGPVFYAQKRVTEGGSVFKIIKFRTMIPNAEKLSGPVLAGENDPRITKIGRFIRAVRLDEIPQLINIIRGEMSIVGPRPERPFFVEQFEQSIPEYHYRLKVKAGLTGLAQVEGKYNTTVEDKLRYDLIYINNYSVLKDFLIMLQTIKILFMKDSTEGVND